MSETKSLSLRIGQLLVDDTGLSLLQAKSIMSMLLPTSLLLAPSIVQVENPYQYAKLLLIILKK